MNGILVCTTLASFQLKKDSCIIGVVDNYNPATARFVAKPVINKLKDVDFWLIPARKLYLLSNSPIAFFEPSYSTTVDPKDPCRRGLVTNLIRVLNSKLRLPIYSVSSYRRRARLVTYPTPPRPTSAARDAGWEHL